MSKEHHVIIGPGMDGSTGGIQFLTRNWEKKFGFTAEILQITWKDTEHFAPKLSRILEVVDNHIDDGSLVSLVGCSASGSAMLNAFLERRDSVHKVVNIDGFLRPGKAKGIRSFERRSASSIAFRESVLRFTELEPSLTDEDRKKILTVRPMFGDELVPPDTVVVQGALNRTVPTGEHILGIATALVKHEPVILFLKGDLDR